MFKRLAAIVIVFFLLGFTLVAFSSAHTATSAAVRITTLAPDANMGPAVQDYINIVAANDQAIADKAAADVEAARVQQEANAAAAAEVEAAAVAAAAKAKLRPRAALPPVAVYEAPAAPSGDGSVDGAIAKYFPDVLGQAYKIATCESGLNPNAVSRTADYGLFQINQSHRAMVAGLGYTWAQLFDPYVNAAVARVLYDNAGWGPWSCKRVL